MVTKIPVKDFVLSLSHHEYFKEDIINVLTRTHTSGWKIRMKDNGRRRTLHRYPSFSH